MAFKSYPKELPMKTIPASSALLLIEFQNEWLGKEGKLPDLMKDKMQFENSKVVAKKVLEATRDSAVEVIHVPLHLSSDYREYGKDRAKFGLRQAIQAFGTWKPYGLQFAKGFEPQENEFVVSGRIGASAFAGSNLDSYLRNNGIERLYLMGYATNVCVESTLRDAHDHGYETLVIHDATAAFTQEQKEFFLQNIVHHFGASMSADAFIEALQNSLTLEPHAVLHKYYAALGRSDLKDALTYLDDKIEYIAIKRDSPTHPELYGTFFGHEGIKRFFAHLGVFYETKAFEVHDLASRGNHAFAKGMLEYRIRKNGQPFQSDWMAYATVQNGKITRYQFFKDTAALETQYQK
jgi:nicotinamidase-related amidase/ketosteroid isomerase-like protein